jgi:hypothetical protein
MADDKKNTGKPDRNLISFKEKYEFNYAVKQLQNQVAETTRQEAKDALMAAARKIAPSEGREKIMREARRKLRG